MRRCLLVLLVLGRMTPGAARAADPIIPPDAKLEHLFDGVCLTEGVAVATDGLVYFSDITFSHVSRNERGDVTAAPFSDSTDLPRSCTTISHREH